MNARTAALVTVFTVTMVAAGFVGPHRPVPPAARRHSLLVVGFLEGEVRERKVERVVASVHVCRE